MTDFIKARHNMVDCQVRPFDVTDRALLAAMDSVPRERFLPDGTEPIAYLDRQVDVGGGRLILTPMVFARLVQALELKNTHRVLDIASGLGYSIAVLAELAGTVIGLENIADLAHEAAARLAAAGVANAKVIAAPLGAPPAAEAPFDAILVNGAVEVAPAAWLDGLADGGRLACIRGSGRAANAILLTRRGSAFGERVLFDAAAAILPGFEQKREFAF